MANDFEITNRGNKLLDQILTWIGNEGLEPEEAVTEEAQTYGDLGALAAALMASGSGNEEIIFTAMIEALENVAREENMMR